MKLRKIAVGDRAFSLHFRKCSGNEVGNHHCKHGANIFVNIEIIKE